LILISGVVLRGQWRGRVLSAADLPACHRH
jgi:hypothetical protein